MVLSRGSVLVVVVAGCGAFGADEATQAPLPPSATLASDVTVQGLLASRDRVAWVSEDRLWLRIGERTAYVAFEPNERAAPGHLAIEGDDLYFAFAAAVERCRMDGAPCAYDLPAPGLNVIGPIAVRNGTLMMANLAGTGSDLYACALPRCSPPTLVATLAGTPTRMVATTAATIVGLQQAATGNASIVKYTGADALTLTSDVKALTGLATDAVYVYWTDAGTGAVRACPIDGGQPKDLATRQAGPRDVAVDGSRLYWLAADEGKVMTCTLPDCSAPSALADVKRPKHLSVGDRVVFASEEDRAIYAVAKPR